MSAKTFPLMVQVVGHGCEFVDFVAVSDFLSSRRSQEEFSNLHLGRPSEALARPRWRLTSSHVCVNLLLLVSVEFDLDTLDASMALHGRCSLSSTAHSRSASSASVRLRSLLSNGSVTTFPRTWARHVRTLSSQRLQVVDASHSSSRVSAAEFWASCVRIAVSCFTRPRFELGLASRGPQVSAKRVRLSCSTKSRISRSCVAMYSTLARARHTCRQHRLHQW